MLEIEGLDVAYGRSKVLYDLSMRVGSGEIVCLLGRNGVGKTTLLKTIVGLLRPTAGAIRLEGDDIVRLPSHERARRGIGYIPQGREIFAYLTVRENLLAGGLAHGGSSASRIDEVVALFPGLRAHLERKGGLLSGGQQQQLAIARALMARPTVLLLDEPTEGIAPAIVDEIGDALVGIARERGTTLLVVEQYLAFAKRLASRFYVMDKGTIRAGGAIAELTEETVKDLLSV
ncbi:MAG: urea ABC transporter ATP-binding subunit UrtE [Vulcanimicrobiaceae bacterium]